MFLSAFKRRLVETQLKAARAAQAAAQQHFRPFYLLRPRIFPDGNMWCALYGENIQEGVAGFGETPEAAAADFDRNWRGQRLRVPDFLQDDAGSAKVVKLHPAD